jgi:hypothetical protein
VVLHGVGVGVDVGAGLQIKVRGMDSGYGLILILIFHFLIHERLLILVVVNLANFTMEMEPVRFELLELRYKTF